MTNEQSQGLLLKATDILGQAWSLYKERFFTFIGIMLFPLLLSGIFLYLVMSDGSFMTSLSAQSVIGEFGLDMVLVAILGVVFVIAQIWGQMALLYAIKDSQENIGIVEAYRRGWSPNSPMINIPFQQDKTRDMTRRTNLSQINMGLAQSHLLIK